MLVYHVVDFGVAGEASDQRYLYSVLYEKMAQEGAQAVTMVATIMEVSWGAQRTLTLHAVSIADESQM